ncbi:MAG: hypothetical protein IJO96_03025 [Oscillospiraceae bacterium]|nr:hypothetical protein [Oscillospiraceae bacterium]
MENKKYILSKNTLGERPAVMWGWMDKLDDEEIVYQIKAFKDAGIEEFYIHPGWTWEGDPYMSEGFLKQIKLAADTAESLGIHYSIYDECGWASGSCGGQLMEKYPENRMSMLFWETANVMAGCYMEQWFKGEVLAVQARYSDKLNHREDITDQVRIEVFGDKEGGRVFWKNDNCASATVWVFTKKYIEGFSATNYWRADAANKPGFIDSLNPDTFRKYFEMNHEKYRKILGDKFGTLIQHIFTDETPMGDWCGKNSRTYSAVLEDVFYKENGYHLRDHFIALTGLFDTDEDIKVRYDFHRTCTKQFCKSFLDQYVEWCRKNNLKLTGHMSGEGVLEYQTYQFGDFYETLSRFDVPGVDNILSKIYVDWDVWGWETKLLASVAKFAGKKRTMCETFSGSGWDLTLEDAKRIMNKLMTLGVTYTIYMTGFSSLNEGRKNFPIGYPPSHGFQNPLFKHYDMLSDYNAVRSSLMEKTMHLGSALILVPQIDAWSNLEKARSGSKLDCTWRECGLALQKRSVEHDMLFESIISDVQVEDGKIKLRGYTYDTLVVPYVTHSDQATLDKLAEFAKQGGRLVFVGRFPAMAADTSKKYNFAEICGLSEEGKNFFTTNEQDYGTMYEGNIMLVRWGDMNKIPKEQFRDEMSAFVRAGSTTDIIEAVDVPVGVTVSRRKAEGLNCGLIFNDTNETKTVKLRINSSDKLSVIEGTTIADLTAEDGIVTLEVAPHDMPIILLTAEGVTVEGLEKAEEKNNAAGESTTVVLDKNWNFTTERYNMLPVKMKFLELAEPCGKLDEELLKRAETASVQFATGEFPAGKGIEFGGGYAAFGRFEIADLPDYLEMFNEVVGDGEIWLNGKRVTGFRRVHEFGPKDSVADITDLAKVGLNTVVVISRVPSWGGPHGMPSIIVRGNFKLDGYKMVALDSRIEPRTYTAQGWRHYSGDSTFSTTFDLEQAAAKVSVEIDTKEVVEVIVNGVSAGRYCWRPYVADITKLCKQGENILELKFTTTMEAEMVIEEVELVSQGFSKFKDEASIKDAGLLSAPKLTIVKA